MATLRKAREMVVIAYTEKILTDEEFIVFYEGNRPINLGLPYFNLEEDMSKAECKAGFRFERVIEPLANVL